MPQQYSTEQLFKWHNTLRKTHDLTVIRPEDVEMRLGEKWRVRQDVVEARSCLRFRSNDMSFPIGQSL